ncbi:MAG: hypothetical protein M3Y69_01220 [Verrucomicrobiota bacterium]|nr:hypothetical protein [Verrucomicrobiota bacterium]
MSSRLSVCVCLLFILCAIARAGDAVVIGYNADGVWTSVMYYSSGTPKGGADYKDEAGAREAATRDLKQRAGEGVVRTSILASSDRTAHVAYARGKTPAGKDLHAVSYAATENDAKAKAFADLRRQGATKELKVFYHYFTHGGDADAGPRH